MQPPRHAKEPTTARPGRLRTAWRAAHDPVPGVPRRMQLLACTVPFTVHRSPGWYLAAAGRLRQRDRAR
ncbi:hypothetical protein T261_7689 [Streptomyces lydicus]|nr:hypothetical protein T261_7689 [Streptomyces lydicus]